MDFQLILTLALVVTLIVGFAVYFLLSQIKSLKNDLKTNDSQAVLMAWLREMKSSVDKSTDTMDKKLNEQSRMMYERLESSQKVIGDIQKQLGGIEEFGRDMKDLSNVLKSPKLRGGLGEQFLYEILANFLPADLYKTQYKFRDGSICDAVVLTDRGIIPIDSKFPMENFKAMLDANTSEMRDKFKKTFISDVKKRIDEIATKYILPSENTTAHAVMYIPSENVYYELIVNTPEIEDYSKLKNVVLASPNTLVYFLKVLLVAFQQQELQKHTHEILKQLAGLKVDTAKFEEEIGTLERHISNAYKAMGEVRTKFGKLTNKLESVQLSEPV